MVINISFTSLPWLKLRLRGKIIWVFSWHLQSLSNGRIDGVWCGCSEVCAWWWASMLINWWVRWVRTQTKHVNCNDNTKYQRFVNDEVSSSTLMRLYWRRSNLENNHNLDRTSKPYDSTTTDGIKHPSNSGNQKRFIFLVALAYVALIARIYLSIFLTSETAKKWSNFGDLTTIVILSTVSVYYKVKEYERKRITAFTLLFIRHTYHNTQC